MKIYFGHSKDFDYENEYYAPIIENDIIQREELIFPHKNNEHSQNERDFYANLDLFIAEVSYPATGLGIELGWAKDDNVPVYCFYKKGITPSRSLLSITESIIEYSSTEDLTNKVEQIISEIKKQKDCKKKQLL